MNLMITFLFQVKLLN